MKVFRIAKLYRRLLSIGIGMFVFLPLAGADIPYFTRFENGFELGSLADQDGWRVEGWADVQESVDFSGSRSVFLRRSKPVARVWREFSMIGEAEPGRIYFDFFLRPVAGSGEDDWTLVEAGAGAVLFAEEDGAGAVFLLDESAEDDPEWRRADFSFPMSKEAFPFLRVTLEQGEGENRLFIGGRPVALSVYEEVAAATEGRLFFSITGSNLGDVGFADFYVGTEDPVGFGWEPNHTNGIFNNRQDRKEQIQRAKRQEGTLPTDPSGVEAERGSGEPLLPEAGASTSGFLQVFTPLE